MAKFLIVSGYGDGAAIGWRLKQEGNEVALYVKDRHFEHAWEGILKKVTKWESFLDRTTTVIFDSTGGGKSADRLRQQGYAVFGSSLYADQLELDRTFGAELMTGSGIKIPETHTFTNLDEGQAFAKRNKDKIWCFKPSGQMPAYLTYIPSDAEDMVRYFDYLKKLMKNEAVEFELQQYIEGVAVSTEAWCDGTRFIHPFNHTIEKKRYGNDDLGPGTGCMGNVVWAEPNACRVVREGIALVEDQVVAGGIGAISFDLNTIVNADGVWGLEWTPRFGYDAISCFLRLYEGEVAKLFHDAARGTWEGEMQLHEGFAGGVRLSIPPFPDEQHPCGPGTPLRGFTKEDVAKNCYFYEVMTGPHSGALVHSGGIGAICSATGVALTPCESLTVPYAVCERAKIPNKYYRTDLKEEFEKMYNEFLSLGG